jgi:hypothetical protein
MFTRAELEFKRKVRNAQLSLRVVVFSVALIVPAWIAAYVAQRMGFSRGLQVAARPGALALLAVYAFGLFRILLRADRDPEVVCPQCKHPLGLSIGKVLISAKCPRCGEKIVR